jgi:hypothetical protein
MSEQDSRERKVREPTLYIPPDRNRYLALSYTCQSCPIEAHRSHTHASLTIWSNAGNYGRDRQYTAMKWIQSELTM